MNWPAFISDINAFDAKHIYLTILGQRDEKHCYEGINSRFPIFNKALVTLEWDTSIIGVVIVINHLFVADLVTCSNIEYWIVRSKLPIGRFSDANPDPREMQYKFFSQLASALCLRRDVILLGFHLYSSNVL